eukprot:g2108.t1
MASNQRYNNDVRGFHDKTTHSGNASGNQQRNSPASTTHVNKSRPRGGSSTGGNSYVPRPVQLPSKRKETQETDPNGGQFANSSWQRPEEQLSSSQGRIDHTSWTQTPPVNKTVSRNGPVRNPAVDSLDHFSSTLRLNQDEFPTLETATDPKYQNTNTRRDDSRETEVSSSHHPSHKGNWYENERHLQIGQGGNERIQGIGGNLHHPVPMPHGTYYPPMQMYPGAPGRPMVQHQGYYGHAAPYSEGLYPPPPPGHFYPPMYPPYHQHPGQGYLTGDQYAEQQELFPRTPQSGRHSNFAGKRSGRMENNDSRRDFEQQSFDNTQLSGAKQFTPRLKLEDEEQNSANVKWSGDQPVQQLIRRQDRGDVQKQDTQNATPEETLPIRQESLTTELLRERQKERSTDLDWDAQVDAEEKKKDKEESTPKYTNPDSVEFQSVPETQIAEWSYAKYRTPPSTEEYTPSPAHSTQRRFVNPIPPQDRANFAEESVYRGGPLISRGGYRARGTRLRGGGRSFRPPEPDRFMDGTSSSEVQSPAPVRMFPGRGFRPKDPVQRFSRGRHQTTHSDPQHHFTAIRFGELNSGQDGAFSERDEVHNVTMKNVEELDTTLPDSLLDPEKDSVTPSHVGPLIQPQLRNGTPRGHRGRGRGPSRGRFSDYRGRGGYFPSSQSPRFSDGQFRGRRPPGIRAPRSEGSYRGSASPFRGRGPRRSSFFAENYDHGFGRGRGGRRDSNSFNTRGTRGANPVSSPKMQWVPKRPPSDDKE